MLETKKTEILLIHAVRHMKLFITKQADLVQSVDNEK